MKYVHAVRAQKTLWQKIYSAFGFWTFREITENGEYLVIYWICFPWVRYYRKFDVIRLHIK